MQRRRSEEAERELARQTCDAPIGRAAEAAWLVGYWPLSPAVPEASTTAPDFAVILQTPLELGIAWPSAEAADGWLQHDVVETPMLPLNACNALQYDGACNMDCVDDSTGVEAFAATQTSDGDLWLVWAQTQRDIVYDYAEPDPPCGASSFGECFCSVGIIDRGTMMTLHLARFDFAAQELTEVLTLPSAPLAMEGWSPVGERRSLDMRAFGDQLVIGWRTNSTHADADGWPAQHRLIQLDTSAL